MPQLSLRSAVSRSLRASVAARDVASAFGARASCAAALLAFGGPAIAQQTPAASETQGADTMQEVVVTGIRRSIESAIETKRESGSIVEAISAEDLGKLPDTSIAESISRLPGLTSQRANGRAQAVSVRGTDPGFTSTLLNGREQVSTGDNRSIEFDQYPSELLSAVIVYKTPDAALVGQGLAGTVDLRTQRPLAYGKRALAFNIRGERNSQDDLGSDSTEDGYRVSFSYIDQFLDGRLGVTFGATRLDSPIASQEFGAYEPWSAGGDGIYRTNGLKTLASTGKDRRDGFMAALEFKPNDTYSTVLDVYYTESDRQNDRRSLEVNLGGYPAPCCDGTFPAGTVFGVTNQVLAGNTQIGGTLNTMVPLARNFLFNRQDEIKAFGWNNVFELGDWKVVGDVSYSEAERTEQQYETQGQFLPNLAAPPGTPRNIYDNGTFLLSADDMPQLSFNRRYDDSATLWIGPTIYGAGYSKFPEVTDELTSARIDVSRALAAFGLSEISFGVNYADREKVKFGPEAALSTISNATGGYHQIDPRFLLAPMNLSYAGSGTVLAWDVPGVLGAYFQPIVPRARPTDGDANTAFLAGKSWQVQEKVTTAYVKGNLDHVLSDSVTLRGNVGVQVVRTDQSSDALYWNGARGRAEPTSGGKKYTDVLPAINLAFSLPYEQTVRVGLAKSLARPRMDQMKAAFEFGISNDALRRPGANGGNPELDPWRANAFDLSYEKYFGTRSYFAAAAFYKDLKTYIFQQTTSDYDFSEELTGIIPCPADLSTLPPNTQCYRQTFGSFTRQLNGSGGEVYGAELSLSLAGEMLTPALEGFGTILSYSYTDSGIQITDARLGPNIPLPGLSKHVWNATVYFERAGFQARVATRARSKYIGEITDFAAERNLRYIKGDQITDAQLGYTFQEGRLEGLSVLFQVNNLTNEPYVAYQEVESRLVDFQEYGRQYLIGINYRL